jgi:hypothetical protein
VWIEPTSSSEDFEAIQSVAVVFQRSWRPSS